MRTPVVLLGLLTFSILLTSRASSQVDHGECDTCYKYWSFDARFTLGGHLAQNPAESMNLFHFRVSQDYGLGTAYEIGQLLDDTTYRMHWIDSAGHPWGGFWVDSGAPALGFPLSDSKRIVDGLRRIRYQQALELGFKLIVHPGVLPGIMKAARVMENYYVMPDDFQMFLNLAFPPQDSANLQWWQVRGWRRDTLTELTGGFHWVYDVGASGDTVLMSGRPDYIGQGFDITEDHGGGLYDRIHHIWTDENGDARDPGTAQGTIDSLADLYDGRKWFSVELALWADEAVLVDDEIPDNAVIAYTDLYLRDTIGQSDTCRCRLFRFWKRVGVTKAEYLETVGLTDSVSGRNAKQAFRDNELEGGRTYYDLDTLIKFDRDTIYNGRTAFDIASSNMGDLSSCADSLFCEALLSQRLALDPSDPAWLPPGSMLNIYANNADFDMRVYSTGIVPVSLFRTRIARHLYRELVAGVFDSIIAEDVLAIWQESRADSLIDRIGIGDEAVYPNIRAWSALSSIVQRAMDGDSLASARPKQFWANPPANFDGFRLFSGDFDSSEFRQAHMVARQRYLINPGCVIPAFYADPDTLGSRARDSILHLVQPDYINGEGDTIRARMIAGNHPDDHRYYRAQAQGDYGSVYDYNTTETASQGPLVAIVARVVDVFQQKYRSRFPNLPSSPVWNVVQTHGHMNVNASQFGALGYGAGWGGTRIPTAEEIRAQAWLSINSGAQGLIFGDFVYNGYALGLVSPHFGENTSVSNLEYGMMRVTNQVYPDTDPRFRVDSMWVGFESRARAVAETTTEIFHVDTLIGWRNLTRRGQISLHDTRLEFSLIPQITTLAMEEADRYDVDSSAGLFSFVGTGTFTPREESYAEITHFTTDDSLEQGWGEGTSFLLITNRLTWPIDLKTYSQSSQDYFDSLHPWFPLGDSGLGAIDVRRPVVVFANATDVIADSLIVERFDTRQPWIDTVAYGDSITLPWHLPGEGRLYRMTPLPSGISEHSTAYNNAVHSENPSTDGETFDRVVVYERDSVVYLRTVDPDGAWSRELMISDPADTVLAGGKRTASNFFPAVALLRDGTARARVVWERDSLGFRSVVTAFIDGADGMSRSTIDSTLNGDYTVVRHRASIADSLAGPPALTPSIVATMASDSTAGFILSWADHVQGINVLALRTAPPNDTLGVADSAGKYQLRKTTGGSVGQYPTLATADIREWMNLLASSVGGPFEYDTSQTHIDNDPPVYPEAAQWVAIPLSHLAWQQGDGVDGDGEHIYYRRLGSFFPTDVSRQPTLVVDGSVEHVSKRAEGCSFEHPSIAADSTRVGVAFEIYHNQVTRRHIALRFRDTVGVNPSTGQPLKEWETFIYGFGRKMDVWGGTSSSDRNVRPSLTHFPLLDSGALELQPDGGLTWFWQNDAPGGPRYQQLLYRYGWFEPRRIADGAHPSLTLVPLVKNDPFEQTSILHRGPEGTRVMAENDEGEDVWYYSGHLLNAPGNPLPALFNVGPQTGSIIANVSIRQVGLFASCKMNEARDPGFDFDIGFVHGGITHPDDDRHGPGDPTTITTEPGLPPTFFRSPGHGATIVDDLSSATGVVRTSLFLANDQPVTIIRGAAAVDSTAEWLDMLPYDVGRSSPADIWSVVELVRAVDSTVLWRGDTISARGLDTNDIESVSHEVEVPVGTYADSGEIVYIQVRAFVSPDVPYEVGGGFAFQAEPIAGGLPKGARQREGETRGVLQLSLVPNPVHDGRTTLHVGTELVGRIEVDVWDVNGRRVGTLPSIDADRPGTYSVELDLEGMRPGSYLVRASATGVERSVTVRLTVVE